MNRRTFLQTLGFGPLGTRVDVHAQPPSLADRAAVRSLHTPPVAPSIRLGNNENPYGPGTSAIDAIARAAASANRYPGPLAEDLAAVIMETHQVPREHVLLSGGSGDVMRAAVQAFTSPVKPLVTARPSYEAPMRSAQHIGSPVIRVPLTPGLRLDVAAMGTRAIGAGLVYICSPNNPTATVVAAADLTAMIERIVSASPETRILVDEAYFGYADMPSFDTVIPLVARHRQVIVTRTFSKIHGMAGMRVAYALAQPDALAAIRRHHSRSSLSAASVAAAAASLRDTANTARIAALNRAVRAWTVDSFATLGLKVAPSDANFIFVNVQRPAREFQLACRAQGVEVGRPFPPMNGWTRIAIGTQDEMTAAMDVFRDVLANPPRPRRARPVRTS